MPARTRIAALAAAAALTIPIGMVATAPTANAAGSASVKATASYWFPPHEWFCKRNPYLKPRC